jgi:hypothetical protein
MSFLHFQGRSATGFMLTAMTNTAEASKLLPRQLAVTVERLDTSELQSGV